MTNLPGPALCLSAAFLAAWLSCGPAFADSAAISSALVFDAMPPRGLFDDRDPAAIHRGWPFCPTDRAPCGEEDLAWVHLRISIDAYSLRRNDPHDSVRRIIRATREDLAPLAQALSNYFADRGVSSSVEQVGFVHGLVQATHYEVDSQTGWTEYPKFGLEFLVDGQGDCDDAAIVATVLLASLGFESYFVSWGGRGDGHLSTAVNPDLGDLQDYRPPKGSRWVEAPGVPRLLHVDATGAPGGCGRSWLNCAPLGFNRWHEKGLRVLAVAGAEDPEIESRIPLSAWKNGGLDRPDRQLVDRRNASDQEIRLEVLDPSRERERLRRRLSGLGIDEARADFFLRPRYPYSQGAYWLFVAASLGVVAVVGIVAWRRRRLRVRRVVELRLQRELEDF